jgi:hypothetical protein
MALKAAALEQLRDTATETLGTRGVAAVILSGIEKFQFAALMFYWSKVSSSIEWIQKCLQVKETTFYKALNQVGTLTDVIGNRKN